MTMQPIRYDQQIQTEVQQVPEEFLPALLSIVHTFRESVSLQQRKSIYSALDLGEQKCGC